MDTQGFYKKDGTGILFSPNIVEGNGYMLLASEHSNNTYPVDGWVWAEDLDDAMQKFIEPVITIPFHVMPEDIFLATSINDETEFNKLATLTGLALSQGKMVGDTIISIHDMNDASHYITISRFLDMIVDYGIYCYGLRQ